MRETLGAPWSDGGHQGRPRRAVRDRLLPRGADRGRRHRLVRSPEGPVVALTGLSVVSSPLLREPHGLDWWDDDRLVVANRAGGVIVLRLAGSEPRSLRRRGVAGRDRCAGLSPRAIGANRHEVLVCDDWRSQVARYELDARGTLTDGRPILGRWLDLPDGIASSSDGRWLAVSNHNTHSVLVFDRDRAQDDGDPAAILRGVTTRMGSASRPTTAGCSSRTPARLACTCSRPSNGWTGAAYPVATIDVMDEPTFLRGTSQPGPRAGRRGSTSTSRRRSCSSRARSVRSRLRRRGGARAAERVGIEATRCCATSSRRWPPRERNARQPQAREPSSRRSSPRRRGASQPRRGCLYAMLGRTPSIDRRRATRSPIRKVEHGAGETMPTTLVLGHPCDCARATGLDRPPRYDLAVAELDEVVGHIHHRRSWVATIASIASYGRDRSRVITICAGSSRADRSARPRAGGRLVGQRAGDRDALLLAAGQLVAAGGGPARPRPTRSSIS